MSSSLHLSLLNYVITVVLHPVVLLQNLGGLSHDPPALCNHSFGVRLIAIAVPSLLLNLTFALIKYLPYTSSVLDHHGMI